MTELDAIEARVLGVLVEKAQTTAAQYPLTLNALVSGCNQKNNRDPETAYNEDDVIAALDGLRAKGLVREVMLSGSRVPKYRHVVREALELDTRELVVLAELLLRGPQTVGEIRGRASRMTPLESTAVVESLLESLARRDPPMVSRVAPATGVSAGSRVPRYQQLLCPEAHRPASSSPDVVMPAESLSTSPGHGAADDIDRKIETLRDEINNLRRELQQLKEQLGAT